MYASHESEEKQLPVVESIVVFLATLFFYVCIGQSCFFGEAGPGYLENMLAGSPGNRGDGIYQAFLVSIHSWGLGYSPFETARYVSALCMALAVTFFHASSIVLGTSFKDRLVLSALVAGTPGILFFSSVIEAHAFFLAFAAFAFLTGALLVKYPTRSMAMIFGLTMALCAAVDPLGALLPLLYLPWFLGNCKKVWGKACARWSLAGLALCVHLNLIFLTSIGIGLQFGAGLLPKEPVADFLVQDFALQELLLPFFPIVRAILMVSMRPSTFKRSSWLLLILLPLLVYSFHRSGGVPSRGAMLLPFVFPAVSMLREFLPRMILSSLVVVSTFVGVLQVVQHDYHEGDRAGHRIEHASVQRRQEITPRVVVTKTSRNEG